VVNGDATLLPCQWQQSNGPVHQTAGIFGPANAAVPWDNSSAVTGSVCQPRLDANGVAIYDGRLLLPAHQMAELRPSSDFDPAVIRALLRRDRDVANCDPYDPELDAAENPEYFHVNAVLFTAHQLRSRRHDRRPFYEN